MRGKLTLLAALLSTVITGAANADNAPANAFTLNTTAFLDQGVLPVLYTCDGKDISPEISWTNPPAKTKSFAVIMTDPSAPNGTFYHWAAYNIPTSAKELVEGNTPAPKGTQVGTNSWGKAQYNGPCPPKGAVHTYVFTFYALDNILKLTGKVDAKAVLDATKGHVLGTATLTAVYSRWIK